MVAQVIKNQIEKFEYRDKKIVWILFSVFVFLLISYGLLINKTIVNAVSLQDTQKEIAVINSDINSMEFQYLNAKSSITMELALSKGFVPISNEKFVVATPAQSGLSLSINENHQ
jgi:hypothetical protein